MLVAGGNFPSAFSGTGSGSEAFAGVNAACEFACGNVPKEFPVEDGNGVGGDTSGGVGGAEGCTADSTLGCAVDTPVDGAEVAAVGSPGGKTVGDNVGAVTVVGVTAGDARAKGASAGSGDG